VEYSFLNWLAHLLHPAILETIFFRKVLGCASPLALLVVHLLVVEKRQRTAAVQDDKRR
jgi:hypothetical protein